MAEFSIISPNGELFPIMENKYFDLIEINGQTKFDTSVYSSTTSGTDGATVNSVVTNARPIVMTFKIKSGVDVEEAKRYIFRYIKPKLTHKIVWERNKRKVEIEGVAESGDMPRWENGVACQITFFCGKPYWQDVESVIQELSNIISLHYFTYSADDMLYFPIDGIVLGEYDLARTRSYFNSGDVSVGLEIVINAVSTVTNPIIYSSPDKFIGVDGVTLKAGEKITITTQKGNKDVTKDGVSIIDKLKQGSTWLQLEVGNNNFTVDSNESDTSNMYFEIKYKQEYV